MDQELRQEKMILYFGDGLDYEDDAAVLFGGATARVGRGEGEEGKEGETLTPGCGVFFSLQILVRNEKC